MTYLVDNQRRATLPTGIKPGAAVAFEAEGAGVWRLIVLQRPSRQTGGRQKAAGRLFPNIEPIPAPVWRRIYARKRKDDDASPALLAAQSNPVAAD